MNRRGRTYVSYVKFVVAAPVVVHVATGVLGLLASANPTNSKGSICLRATCAACLYNLGVIWTATVGLPVGVALVAVSLARRPRAGSTFFGVEDHFRASFRGDAAGRLVDIPSSRGDAAGRLVDVPSFRGDAALVDIPRARRGFAAGPVDRHLGLLLPRARERHHGGQRQ